MFIGYPFNVKGYRVFDLHSHYIFISRDIIFYESVFPFHTSVSTPSSTTDLPIPLPYNSPLPFDDLPHPSSSHLASPSASSSSLDNTIIQMHHELDDEFLHDVPIKPPEPLADPIPLRKSFRVHKSLLIYKLITITWLLPLPLLLFSNQVPLIP